MRLIYLSPSRNTDSNLPALTAGIYTEIAVNFALISSSVTCLKPFLRPFDTDYLTHTSRTNGLSGGIKNSRGDTYYMLSATQSRNDKNHSTLTTMLSDRGAMDSVNAPAPSFRPDDLRNRATVECSSCRDEMKSSDLSRMTISMTKEWDVTYEDGLQAGVLQRDCNHEII